MSRHDRKIPSGSYFAGLTDEERIELQQSMSEPLLLDLASTGHFPQEVLYVESFHVSSPLLTVKEWRAFQLSDTYKTWTFRKACDADYWDYFYSNYPCADHLPIINLTVLEATAAAKWLGYRLPTESELEYLLIKNNKSSCYVDRRRKRWILNFDECLATILKHYDTPQHDEFLLYRKLPPLLCSEDAAQTCPFDATGYCLKPGGLFSPHFHICGRITRGYFMHNYHGHPRIETRVFRMYSFGVLLVK